MSGFGAHGMGRAEGLCIIPTMLMLVGHRVGMEQYVWTNNWPPSVTAIPYHSASLLQARPKDAPPGAQLPGLGMHCTRARRCIEQVSRFVPTPLLSMDTMQDFPPSPICSKILKLPVPKNNFYSTHSWLGILALALLATQVGAAHEHIASRSRCISTPFYPSLDCTHISLATLATWP